MSGPSYARWAAACIGSVLALAQQPYGDGAWHASADACSSLCSGSGVTVWLLVCDGELVWPAATFAGNSGCRHGKYTWNYVAVSSLRLLRLRLPGKSMADRVGMRYTHAVQECMDVRCSD